MTHPEIVKFEEWAKKFAEWPFDRSYCRLTGRDFRPGGKWESLRVMFEEGMQREGLDPDVIQHIDLDYTAVSGLVKERGKRAYVKKMSWPASLGRAITKAQQEIESAR